MKVLHIIPSLDPETGGPPMVAVRLAAAQSALGCQTQIISYRFPEADARITASIAAIPNISAVKLEYLPPLTKPERFLARGARRRLQPIVSRFDLIHLHGVWDPLIKAVADLAAEQNKPYVLTPHGSLDPWAISQRRWKKQLALMLGYRQMLDHAVFIHYLNADEKRRAEILGFTAAARVLSNGIFLEELNPLPPEGSFRLAHPELADAKLILFLARLHFVKGLDFLADAFAIVAREFPKARLVVAGPDYGARSDFESQIARLGIAGRVHLVGPLYGAHKLGALRDCDCFCLPSRKEGFSLAVTEAMACSAPVVISTECHFPEVKGVNAGVIADLNAAAIAAALATVLRDPAAARQMGRNGHELIVTRFTWPTIAAQMVEYYKAALTSRPPER